MQQVVALGYAIDNGKTGKDYAIHLKENAGNSGNNSPQSLDRLGTEAGNKSGNSLVTTAGTHPEMPTEQTFKMGNNLDSPNIGVATALCSHNNGNGGVSSESPGALLPGVTTLVTTLKTPSSKESKGICYPVTATVLQVGDRAVLTKEGNNRPANELKAIWTVKAMQEEKVVIHYEGLGDRVFPQDWLERYA